MLVEIVKAVRKEGDLTRRWFTSPDIDLYIWHTLTNQIEQFQLCHKRPPQIFEHGNIVEDILTWHRDLGFRFDVIPDSKGYSSPILIERPLFDTADMRQAYFDSIGATATTTADLEFIGKQLKTLDDSEPTDH